MLSKTPVVALLAAAFLLSSCNVAGPHVSVLRGNYSFGRGQYQAATVHYLSANVRPEHEPYIDYNLGNVYYALGELDAALGKWADAAAEAPDQILFGVHFNRGVLNYELGRYEDAYSEFRRCLEIDGTSVDAKINLELSLQKLEATSALGPSRAAVSAEQSGELGAQAARILEYIRRKERQRWVADDRTLEHTAQNDW